jgi:hypothetical protein
MFDVLALSASFRRFSNRRFSGIAEGTLLLDVYAIAHGDYR